MKAALIQKPMSMVFTDVEEPQITKVNELKIKVKVTGICGSEIHAYHGRHSYRKPPVVSGHEFAGEVVEIGSNVTKYSIGDRVTVEPQYGCGECTYCRNGYYNVCKNKVVLGSNKWSGSFGEYIIAPEVAVILLPDNLTYEQGSLIEPLAVGLHIVKKSKLEIGQTAAIIGAGTIGLSILISAKMAGVQNIIVSDIVEYNLQVAKQLGATYCINSTREDAVKMYNHYSVNTGIDVVFVAVDAISAFQTALDIVSPQGTIGVLAPPRNTQGSDMGSITGKEMHIVGSYMYVRREFEMIRDKIADGTIDVTPLISKIMPIEDAAQAMEIADKKSGDIIKILMRF
jgi:threonine dehydrogenase-like Zn-dependent dehydrogenase